jgi:hypothetical protein
MSHNPCCLFRCINQILWDERRGPERTAFWMNPNFDLVAEKEAKKTGKNRLDKVEGFI